MTRFLKIKDLLKCRPARKGQSLISKEKSIEPKFKAMTFRRNSAESVANNKDTRPERGRTSSNNY